MTERMRAALLDCDKYKCCRILSEDPVIIMQDCDDGYIRIFKIYDNLDVYFMDYPSNRDMNITDWEKWDGLFTWNHVWNLHNALKETDKALADYKKLCS